MQTAAERRAAETLLRGLFVKLAPQHVRLLGSIRRSLLKRLPTTHELVYEYRTWVVISYSPSDRGFEGVFAIRASAKGVELHFNRGKELSDPTKLLRGSGKQVRGMQVEAASVLAKPAVVRLMKEAIARNPVPFPRKGRGSILVRSASATKRSKGRAQKAKS
jgi:hypothetical protein